MRRTFLLALALTIIMLMFTPVLFHGMQGPSATATVSASPSIATVQNPAAPAAVQYLSLGSVLGYLSSSISHGATWFYNHTIGAFSSWVSSEFQGFTLSATEDTINAVMGVVVAGLASISDAFSGVISSVLFAAVGLSSTFGVIGPVMALLFLLGILIVGVILVRALIDIA